MSPLFRVQQLSMLAGFTLASQSSCQQLMAIGGAALIEVPRVSSGCVEAQLVPLGCAYDFFLARMDFRDILPMMASISYLSCHCFLTAVLLYRFSVGHGSATAAPRLRHGSATAAPRQRHGLLTRSLQN